MNPTIEWGNLHDKVNHPVITKEMVRAAIIDAAKCNDPVVIFEFDGDETESRLARIYVSSNFDSESFRVFGTTKAKNITDDFFENLCDWMAKEIIKVNPQYCNPTKEPIGTFFCNYLSIYVMDVVRDNFLVLDRWFTFKEWEDMLFNGAEYEDDRPAKNIAYKK